MNFTETRTLNIWTEAEKRKLLKHVADLPSPKRIAESLEEASLLALIRAERNRFNEYLLRQEDRGGAAARELVEAGVVEISGVFISNFGMQVRREALKMKLYGELG